MTQCLYNQEPLTVRTALLELFEHFNQSVAHDTTSHLTSLGMALIDVMSSSSLGEDVQMIAASMVHRCVPQNPLLDHAPWVRARSMHLLSKAMRRTFQIKNDTTTAATIVLLFHLKQV